MYKCIWYLPTGNDQADPVASGLQQQKTPAELGLLRLPTSISPLGLLRLPTSISPCPLLLIVDARARTETDIILEHQGPGDAALSERTCSAAAAAAAACLCCEG